METSHFTGLWLELLDWAKRNWFWASGILGAMGFAVRWAWQKSVVEHFVSRTYLTKVFSDHETREAQRTEDVKKQIVETIEKYQAEDRDTHRQIFDRMDHIFHELLENTRNRR